jgi:hypothetical protein
VQYFAQWAIYGRNFKPWHMQLDKITHVHYAFFDVTAVCAVATLDSWADFEIVYPEVGMSWNDGPNVMHGNIGAFQRLRVTYPNVKLALSLGGWTKSTYFSSCAKDPTKRANLIASAVAMLRRTDFDGIDVDWECTRTRAAKRMSRSARPSAGRATLTRREPAPIARLPCLPVARDVAQTRPAAASTATRSIQQTGPTTCCSSRACAPRWTPAGRPVAWSLRLRWG